MEQAWFSSTFGFKPKKKTSFGTISMSALPHMANPSAVGLGRERPISGSDFFQSWPKWKHLVLIRDSGCDSCSGSCEDLAVGCNADCGTRTKYTNISTVIMCQVKQAIEGSGWMSWEGVLSERARCVTWMQGIEWDPQQDKLGHQTLIGFRIFFGSGKCNRPHCNFKYSVGWAMSCGIATSRSSGGRRSQFTR